MDPRASDTVRRVLLQVPNRRRIYEAVVAMPGIHLRDLSRRLHLALGSIEHHVRQLEKHGLVFCHKGGRRHSYFATGQVDPADALVLHAMRKPLWARLMAALVAGQAYGVSSLAFKVNEAPTTVSYNLRRMRETGILEQARVGRESMYLVREPDRVARLLREFRPGGDGAAPDMTFCGVVERAAQPADAADPVDDASISIVARR